MNKLTLKITILFLSTSLWSATNWNLNSYLHQSRNKPEHLIKKAPEILGLKTSTLDKTSLRNWQDRVAIILALSEVFSPEFNTAHNKTLQKETQEILLKTLNEDPALLVRDTTVESLRRIFRMDPHQIKFWKKHLETAFFDPQNIVDGNGLFIRETILSTMRESGMRPSKKMLAAIRKDKNPRVREKVNLWTTHSF